MKEEYKYIKWLGVQADTWVKMGFISNEQNNMIIDFYKDNNYPKKQDLLPMILAIIGSILVGLGTILLIGKNWEMLSRETRLVISVFPFLIGFSFAFWFVTKNPNKFYLESSGIFISISIIAGLGLVGQTYHVVSPAQSLYLASALISIPFIYLIQSTLSGIAYVVLVCIAISLSPKVSPDTLFFEGIILILLLVPYILNKKNKTSSFELEWLKGIMLFSGIIIIFSTASTEVFIFEKLIVYGLFLITCNDQKLYNSNFMRYIGIFIIFSIFFSFTFEYRWRYFEFNFDLEQWIILLFLLLSTLILMYRSYQEHQNVSYLPFMMLPLLSMVYNFIPHTEFLENILFWGFNAAFFITAIYYFFTGYKSMIHENSSILKANMGLLLILVIISKWFFDMEISFLARGLLFIILGISFLIFNFIFSRQKRGISHEK